MADKKNNNKIEIKRQKENPMILSDVLYYVERSFFLFPFFVLFLFSWARASTHIVQMIRLCSMVLCVFSFGALGGQGQGSIASRSKTEDDGRRQYDSCWGVEGRQEVWHTLSSLSIVGRERPVIRLRVLCVPPSEETGAGSLFFFLSSWHDPLCVMTFFSLRPGLFSPWNPINMRITGYLLRWYSRPEICTQTRIITWNRDGIKTNSTNTQSSVHIG